MGASKAGLDFGGQPLLRRIVGIVGRAADPVVVSAAADQDLPQLEPGVSVIRDSLPDRGPLQGLADSLAVVRDHCDAVFVCTCDAPFLTPAYIRRLAELLGPHDASVPVSGDSRQPLSAVYRARAADTIDRLLASDRLSMMGFIDELDVRLVAPDAWVDLKLRFDPLRNLNTPEQYGQALREFRIANGG
jgi:molybdopterin-guanine dinucleotide biosynthesis protein A